MTENHIPAAVASLWGSPGPRKNENHQSLPQGFAAFPPQPLNPPMTPQQQGPVTVGGEGGDRMMHRGLVPGGWGEQARGDGGEQPGGRAGGLGAEPLTPQQAQQPSAAATLSQMLNIAPSTPAAGTPAGQGTRDDDSNKLPTPVAPLARPGNSLLSKLLAGGGLGGPSSNLPPMPKTPMMSAADIERQLMGAAAGTPAPSAMPQGAAAGLAGGSGGGFNAVNFFAQFQGSQDGGQLQAQPPPPQQQQNVPGHAHQFQNHGQAPMRPLGGGLQGTQGAGAGAGGFDAGSFFSNFAQNSKDLPAMPPASAVSQAGAWGAVPNVVPRG